MEITKSYIVIAAKKNEKYTNGRRKEEQSVLGERVGIEQSIPVANSNAVLSSLVGTIQRCQVNVGRRLVDIGVTMRCTEYTVFGWQLDSFYKTMKVLTCG